ncbi:MAG: hypothetical protein HUJ68_12300, partial [Clostridia bacterium]|nr:hypothetical protein [Clostridia bacterium]
MQGINLLKNDYERYVFPISLVNTVGRKKNRYITSELEQRHPCFSDNFCFDDLLKISKKGLVSDVIVIDKSKLAEYRRKTKWWISFFRTEDTGRICFVSEKTKMIFIILFLVLVSSAFITVSFEGKK